MSYLLTKAVAERAVELVTPWIKQLVERGTLKRSHLHVVVATRNATGGMRWRPSFSESILCQMSFRDDEPWEHEFDKIALSKASISWRTGLPSRIVVLAMPHLLEEGDTRWWGSAVLDEIVVACSGVQPWYDEMISMAIAAACRAICLGEMHTGIMKTDYNFLGEEAGLGAPPKAGT